MERKKCFAYWPEDSPVQFESLTITCENVSKEKDFVTRTFMMKEQSTGKNRTVRQLQYTAWPDQGLPENREGFRSLVSSADEYNTDSSAIVVHCSAGIGRTGVFCIVHNTLAKLRLLLTESLDLDFNLKQNILKLREQRAGMVQTEEQYAFCYLSILNTVIHILNLIGYKNEKWFHKNLDSNEANKLLQTKPHGSFIFRASSAPGCIVLSAVSSKNVLHARISVSEKGFELEKDIYPSLTKLVESRRQVLMHPILRH